MNLIKRLRLKEIKKLLFRGLDPLADRAGYERKGRRKPVDFRGILDDPLDAYDRANGWPVSLNVHGEDCRGLETLAYPITKNSYHPMILTGLNYISGRCTDYLNSPLYDYYEKYQPRNGAQIIGLSEGDCSSILSKSPRTPLIPWGQVLSPQKAFKLRSTHVKTEAHQFGFKLFGTDGESFYGPVSSGKGELEFFRVR